MSYLNVLVLAVITTMCCCMATAAPFETSWYPKIESFIQKYNTSMPPRSSSSKFAFNIVDINSIFQPRVSKSVRSLMSQYKTIVVGIVPTMYGNTLEKIVGTASVPGNENMCSPDMHSLCMAVFGRKDEIVSSIKAQLDSQLDLALKPTHDKFMSEATKILDAVKEKALVAKTNRANSVAVIREIAKALKPVEQELKEDLIDFLLKSVPDMIEKVLVSATQESNNAQISKVVHNTDPKAKKLLEVYLTLKTPGGSFNLQNKLFVEFRSDAGASMGLCLSYKEASPRLIQSVGNSI